MLNCKKLALNLTEISLDVWSLDGFIIEDKLKKILDQLVAKTVKPNTGPIPET